MTALRLVLVLLLVVVGSSALAQTVPDPQSLVGQWAGIATLISARGVGNRGAFAMSIDKVDGGKVYGRTDNPSGGPPANFVGSFAGNRITFYTGRFETALTVAGKRMYGVRRAGADNDNFELGLEKVEQR